MDEAAPLLELAISIGEDTLGEKHPDVAVRYSNLALVRKKQAWIGSGLRGVRFWRGFGRSLAWHQLVLVFLMALLCMCVCVCAGVCVGVGGCARRGRGLSQGRLRVAGTLYKKSLEIDQGVFGDNHPRVATDYTNLGALYKTKVSAYAPSRVTRFGRSHFSHERTRRLPYAGHVPASYGDVPFCEGHQRRVLREDGPRVREEHDASGDIAPCGGGFARWRVSR